MISLTEIGYNDLPSERASSVCGRLSTPTTLVPHVVAAKTSTRAVFFVVVSGGVVVAAVIAKINQEHKRVLFGPSCAPPAGVSPLRRHLRLAILPLVLYFFDTRALVECTLPGMKPPDDAHRNATAHPRRGL